MAPRPIGWTPPPPPSRATRHGLAFEANLGFAFLSLSRGIDSEASNALGGINLGIGGYAAETVAITFRVAGATYTDDGARVTQAIIGPSIQYFATDHLFLGGGLGIGVLDIEQPTGASLQQTGTAIDLRAGYVFNPSAKHAFHASLEFVPTTMDGISATSFGFLAGYQLQ